MHMNVEAEKEESKVTEKDEKYLGNTRNRTDCFCFETDLRKPGSGENVNLRPALFLVLVHYLIRIRE